MKSNRKPRVGPLDTVQAVRREMGRIYRLARYGELEIDSLRAFVYTLKELRESLPASGFGGEETAMETAHKIRAALDEMNAATRGAPPSPTAH